MQAGIPQLHDESREDSVVVVSGTSVELQMLVVVSETSVVEQVLGTCSREQRLEVSET